MRNTRIHANKLVALVTLLASLSIVGLISAAADGSGPARHPVPKASEPDPGDKDCSKIKDCKGRCQCEYDQCATPCGVYETECVKTCIKAWHTCTDACKS